MSKRILNSAFAVLLALSPTAVFAQSDANLPPVYCGDLAKKDCQLLEDAQAAMAEVSSSVADSQITFNLSNIPELPIQDASFTVDLHQVAYIDPQWNADMRGLMMGAADAMQDDAAAFMEEYMQLSSDLFSNASFDIEVNVAMSDELTRYLSKEAGTKLPAEFSVDMRMLDGVMYFNLEDLANSLGEEGIPTGWLGVDIASAMEQQMDASLAQMESEVDQLSDSANLGLVFALMNPTGNEEIKALMDDVVTLERLDDDEVDGVEVAQFLSTVDFAALLTNETFLELIFAQLESTGAAEQLGNMDIEEVASMVQLVAPMLAQGVTMESVQLVGLDDGYVYGADVNLSWDLSTIMQLVAMGEGRAARRARANERPIFEMSVSQRSSAFNDAPEIEAPEDAELIPLDNMQ